MIKQNQKWLNLMNLLGDAVLTFLSWFIAGQFYLYPAFLHSAASCPV